MYQNVQNSLLIVISFNTIMYPLLVRSTNIPKNRTIHQTFIEYHTICNIYGRFILRYIETVRHVRQPNDYCLENPSYKVLQYVDHLWTNISSAIRFGKSIPESIAMPLVSSLIYAFPTTPYGDTVVVSNLYSLGCYNFFWLRISATQQKRSTDPPYRKTASISTLSLTHTASNQPRQE